jgi:hypothetical protein
MKNPRGRPPLDRDDPSAIVCVAMPSRVLELIRKEAHAEQLTVPEIIRRALGNKKIQIRDR